MHKKFLTAGIVAFLCSVIFSFVAHGILLHADYAAVANLMRTDAEARSFVPFMLLAHLIKGFAIVWIYRQGISPDKPWLVEGFRFGIAAALLTVVPLYLLYYAVQPMPGVLIVKQIVTDSIGSVLLGVSVAFFFRAHKAGEDAAAA